MPKRLPDTRPDTILCACGCGEIVPKTRYVSQQNYYINQHQHRGENNGNFKGGKTPKVCGVCQQTYYTHYPSTRSTCGNEECHREWQRMTTTARGQHRTNIECAYCKRPLQKWPSQVKEKNYCNRHCMNADIPKMAHLNGNWQGGKWKFIKEQAMIRDNYKCVICGFDFAVHVHHITPLSDGGTNEFSNLITICPNHHAMVHAGAISLEYLRNYDWQPITTTDPTPHANH